MVQSILDTNRLES